MIKYLEICNNTWAHVIKMYLNNTCYNVYTIGMYIRKISRKNKDGSTATYVQLANNEWNPEKEFAVAKVIHNFGRIENLDLEQLKRPVKSISRFLAPPDAMEAQASLNFDGNDVRLKSCRSYGGIFILQALWQQFHFQQILEKRTLSRQIKTPITRAIFAMVANRCLEPSSKSAVSDWVEKDVHIPGLPQVDVKVLYLVLSRQHGGHGYHRKGQIRPGPVEIGALPLCSRCRHSESNLQCIQRAGGHYIVGRKFKSGEAEVELVLSQKGPFTEIGDHLSASEVVVGKGEKRLVLVGNADEEQRQRTVRRQIIETIEKQLTTINKHRSKTHTKAICELKSHPVYGKYIKELQDGRLKIDRARIKEEIRYNGKFLVETNDDTLSLRDIVLGYKQLNDVEKAFRTIKPTPDLPPNYHSKDQRLRCHIFLCFLAQLMAGIVENKMQKSWSSIRQELKRLYLGELIVEQQRITQLTELSKKQKEILSELGVKEPSPIIDIR
jgi:hypothetical protein